jgi:hypothetical protein
VLLARGDYVAGDGVGHGLYLGAGFRPSVKSRTYRHARALTASEIRRSGMILW